MGHFANVKVRLECAEKEKYMALVVAYTWGVRACQTEWRKSQCLSGNKTGYSQPSRVTVPWGEAETATPMGMKSRHMPRRHVGDKAGTCSRIGLTVSAAQWCAKNWQI